MNQEQGKVVEARPELICVVLENNDAALFLNDVLIYSLGANDEGQTAPDLGRSMESALGVQMRYEEMAVPLDEDWNWNDVLELIPVMDRQEPEVEEVEQQGFDEIQQCVIQHYEKGEFSHLSPSDVEDCGDGLLKFLLVELSKQEDCENFDVAVQRVETAMRQLQYLRTDLANAYLNPASTSYQKPKVNKPKDTSHNLGM